MANNFCVIPWISITSDNAGLIRPCCKFAENDKQDKYPTGSLKTNTYEEIWNGDNFKNIRQAFLDNKKIPECSSCWKEEAAGHLSYRKMYNSLYLENKEYTLEADPPRIVDLKLSNICNFKCRMCDFSYSSLIMKEDIKHRGYNIPDALYYRTNKILGTNNEEYFFSDILPNLIQIEFTGGEPFVSPEAREIITRISETEYAKDIVLQIITNGSTVNKQIVEEFKSFNRVRIGISLDDIDDRLEYQRNGAVWETIKSNIFSLKSLDNVDLNIHCTVNNYNIWDLHFLFNWAEENKIKVVTNILHGPERLCIKNLHQSIKDKIWNKHGSDHRFKTILKYMNQERDPNVTDFIPETELIDNIRNENFRKVFPEWSELIYAYM